MKKLFILFMGIFFSISVFASETVLNLDQQIPHVKEYLKTTQHPRLILGVGNVPELSGIPGPNPFLNNPDDILLNLDHKPGILVNRTLTVNFNDLAQLNKLADALPDTFDVIIADFLVTKYTDWTKDHLLAFKRMLKSGGRLFLPIDSNFNKVIMLRTDTVEDLFKQTTAQEGLQNKPELFITGNKWIFEPLPTNLNIPIDLQKQQEIDRKVEEYKKARPLVNEWISNKRPRSGEALNPLKEEFSKIGLDPMLVGKLLSMNPSTLNDDQHLANYVRNQIIAPQKTVVQYELSDKFIEEYLIPLNLNRILGEVFNPQQIVIKKNMATPQPYRQPTFAGFSISATK